MAEPPSKRRKRRPSKFIQRISIYHRFVVDFADQLAQFMKRPALLFLTIVTTTSVVGFSLLIFTFEAEINPDITTLLDALYFSVTTFTTIGFGDITPVTNLGKILTMLMMIEGAGLFASYTAVIAATLLQAEASHKGTNYVLRMFSKKDNKNKT